MTVSTLETPVEKALDPTWVEVCAKSATRATASGSSQYCACGHYHNVDGTKSASPRASPAPNVARMQLDD